MTTQTTSSAQLPYFFQANSFQVSEVIDGLSLHVGNLVTLKDDDLVFINLCLSLSRCLEIAFAHHHQIDRKQELPSLIKRVCQIKKNDRVLAANMVLMITIKNACDLGWFPGKDSEELKDLAEEIAKNFGGVPISEANPSGSLYSVLSTVMLRFYPRMKLGDVLVCFEVKSGFETYVKDFLILKKKTPCDGEVRLFVIQKDTIETSSCLITPAKVNFLLNGKGVERRNDHFVDAEPQLPTVVSCLLKYGSNLLQAVGEFNGNYIVAVAYASETQNPECVTLQEYLHHADVMSSEAEGPSLISLICPISSKRIKTPVKGQSCKHTQCFDFENYVDTNSRTPSWRCPHCNEHVCFTNIRIDQKMVQLLKETKENTSTEVMISSDWSLKPAVMESDNAAQKPHDKPIIYVDLTQTDDDVEDTTQPPLTRAHGAEHPAVTNNATDSRALDDNFWPEVYLSTFEQVSNNRSSRNGRFSHITRVPTAIQALPAAVRTPTNSSSVPRQAATPCPCPLPISLPQLLHPSSCHNPQVPHHRDNIQLGHQPQANHINRADITSNVPGLGTPSPSWGNVGISPQPFSTMNSDGLTAEQNWRPAARMRGALSGQAYADAFNQFITEPSQRARVVRPVLPNVVSAAASVDQMLPNYSNTGPHGTKMHGGSGGGFTH